eukprot:93565_1
MATSTNSDSKKRSITELNSECEGNMYEPLSKKRKLDVFEACDDQLQFEEILDEIKQCQFIQSLNIPYSINHLIAEYSTGFVEPCGNDKCQNEVVVLSEDYIKYNNDHSNCHEFGYKMIYNELNDTNIFYCSQCMNLAKKCGCNGCDVLSFIPDCDKCTKCKNVIFECDTSIWSDNKCKCSIEFVCSHCNEIRCNKCEYNDEWGIGFLPCMACHSKGDFDESFCTKCMELPAGKDMDYCICCNCYNESMDINECKYCGEKALGKFIYDSEYHFLQLMECNKCKETKCDLYCRYEQKPCIYYCSKCLKNQ